MGELTTPAKMEQTKAYEFLEKDLNPESPIDELVKGGGVFTPEEIANLKEIMGEAGYAELVPSILGRIYQKARAGERVELESLNPNALRNVINTINDTYPNKLVDLVGKDGAELLEQSALFAEWFGRAKTWHKGSPTAKLQAVAGTAGFFAFLDGVGNMLTHGAMYGNYDLTNLTPVGYVGIGLIATSFGGAAGYKHFLTTPAGQRFLVKGWNMKIPGTERYIRSADLNAAADWMIKNRFEIGYTSTAAAKAEREGKEAMERIQRWKEQINNPLLRPDRE